MELRERWVATGAGNVLSHRTLHATFPPSAWLRGPSGAAEGDTMLRPPDRRNGSRRCLLQWHTCFSG